MNSKFPKRFQCVCVHEQTFFLLFPSAHFIAHELQSGYSIILALYVH